MSAKIRKTMFTKPKKIKEGTKLYFGTSERLAKLSPITGLSPGNMEGGRRPHGKQTKLNRRNQRLYLTSVYPAYFAFCNTEPGERWGIVEIDAASLDADAFLPDEDYLLDRHRNGSRNNGHGKKRPNDVRVHLAEYQQEWRECLERFGTCVYEAPIQQPFITRVAIYDPSSNAFMTRQVVDTTLSVAGHQSGCRRHRHVTAWLMGENITCQSWLADEFDTTSIEDRDRIIDALQDTSGLDIFYFGPAPKKLPRPKWVKAST
jgi:hypothetical protein